MRPRFFFPDARAGGVDWLPDEEGRHLTQVLRLGLGELVGVFDGEGREYIARVEAISHGRVSVRTIERVEAVSEPAGKLTLAQAVLKTDSMSVVIRDAVMLGVSTIKPIITTRTNMARKVRGRPGNLARWRRVASSSAKQCGRAKIPEISPVIEFESFIKKPGDECRLILVEPSVDISDLYSPYVLREGGIPNAVTVAVGPNGGWTGDEVSLALANGFRPVRLGRLTLRAEAVPSVVLSVIQFCLGEL
jgi:16S rRNA (uracil1498-N3)-methyltransferase